MNLVKITEELVEFRTIEGNHEEIEKSLEFIQQELSDNFDFRRFEEDGEKSMLVTRGENPRILLHGHIDVVDAEDSLFHPEVKGGRIYGRGSADMKTGLACLMNVLEKVESSDLGLLITSDEERGGFNGTGYVIEEAGLEPDFVISAEPDDSGSFPSIVTKQKGVLQLEITTEGKNAHASKPEKGKNAAENLIEKYREFRDLFDHSVDFSTTISLGSISAEGPVNQIPGSASLQVDIRYSNQYPKPEILSDLEEISGIEYEILAEAPMMETSENGRCVQSLKESAEQAMGEKVEFRKEKFASDMRFFTEKDIPAVCFGPEGYNLHGENEYVEIESLKTYCEILKNFLELNLDYEVIENARY